MNSHAAAFDAATLATPLEAVRQTYNDVGALFNRVAPNYDQGAETVGWKGHRFVFESIQRHLDQKRLLEEGGLHVLDLGTGTGLLAELFKASHSGNIVTGVDLSSESLGIAKTKGRIDRDVLGTVTSLQWSNDRVFDVVTSSGVLDFIKETEGFAHEVARVLKPGGIFGITFEPTGTSNDGFKTLQHDPDVLERQFTAAGARILRSEQIESAYLKYQTRTPVTNHLLVGQVLEAVAA